jgi:hypothetical protein
MLLRILGSEDKMMYRRISDEAAKGLLDYGGGKSRLHTLSLVNAAHASQPGNYLSRARIAPFGEAGAIFKWPEGNTFVRIRP